MHAYIHKYYVYTKCIYDYICACFSNIIHQFQLSPKLKLKHIIRPLGRSFARDLHHEFLQRRRKAYSNAY